MFIWIIELLFVFNWMWKYFLFISQTLANEILAVLHLPKPSTTKSHNIQTIKIYKNYKPHLKIHVSYSSICIFIIISCFIYNILTIKKQSFDIILSNYRYTVHIYNKHDSRLYFLLLMLLLNSRIFLLTHTQKKQHTFSATTRKKECMHTLPHLNTLHTVQKTSATRNENCIVLFGIQVPP